MNLRNAVSSNSTQIGQLLLDNRLVSEDDLERGLALQKSTGVRLGMTLVRIGAISEENLLTVLAQQLNVDVLDAARIPDMQIAYSYMISSPISFDWYLHHGVIAWPIDEEQLACAARDVLDPSILEGIERSCKQARVKWFLLSSYLHEQLSSTLRREHDVDRVLNGSEDASYLKQLAEEAPVIEFVNNVLSQAVDADSSDIHVEPQESNFKVRFRMDGVLRDQFVQPIERFPAVCSRIKLVAGLDIAERRLPQDGRITSRVSGEEMDLRVSTLPGVFGESIVMRLLPKNREALSLERLGLEQDHLDLMREWALSSGGIVLVTGPTGSGKSTTLHGALSATNDGIRKIITVEDPVEVRVAGITQIQVHSEIGFSFARVLRSVLRQDPDVIMVGEIRDLETAEIAIQSALSGHLVLSTLHTNDAIAAFTRLIDMGVEPFLVAAPLKGVQAQRLVRRLCSHCAYPQTPPAEILSEVKQLPRHLVGNSWKSSSGCEECNGTGFAGRVGIYQMVPIDEAMRDMIVKGESLGALRRHSEGSGYRSLYQDGLIKASNGHTSVEELLRVTVVEESV